MLLDLWVSGSLGVDSKLTFGRLRLSARIE